MKKGLLPNNTENAYIGNLGVQVCNWGFWGCSTSGKPQAASRKRVCSLGVQLPEAQDIHVHSAPTSGS